MPLILIDSNMYHKPKVRTSRLSIFEDTGTMNGIYLKPLELYDAPELQTNWKSKSGCGLLGGTIYYPTFFYFTFPLVSDYMFNTFVAGHSMALHCM